MARMLRPPRKVESPHHLQSESDTGCIRLRLRHRQPESPHHRGLTSTRGITGSDPDLTIQTVVSYSCLTRHETHHPTADSRHPRRRWRRTTGTAARDRCPWSSPASSPPTTWSSARRSPGASSSCTVDGRRRGQGRSDDRRCSTAGELEQEQAFYTAGAEGATSQVAESAAALRFQERQVTDQIRQAEANLAADAGAADGRAGGARERARSASTAPTRCRSKASSRSRSSTRRAPSYQVAQSKIDIARQADRGAARRRGARTIERGPGVRSAAASSATNQKQQAAAAAAARQGRRQARLHRASRADRRHRRRARRAHRRGRDPGPADRHADQSGRSVGARQRRRDLHRSRPRGRQADGPPAVRRRARRHGLLPRRRSRRSPRSATSAARSATSRRSRSGCAWTTAIAASRSA